MNSRSGMWSNTEQLANQIRVWLGTRETAGHRDVHSLGNKEHQLQDSRWLRIREREGIYAGQQVAENKREGGDLCRTAGG